MTTDEFWARPIKTTTWTFCDECKQLREDPDVQERVSYWPHIKVRCCASCFQELTSASYAGVTIC
jgi:hypothetical protein